MLPGWCWLIDLAPAADGEYSTPGNQGEQHRTDQFPVLNHELGHVLGLEYEESAVMVESPAAGRRPLQEGGQDPFDLVFAELARVLDSNEQHRKG